MRILVVFLMLIIPASCSAAEVPRVNRARIILDLVKDGEVTTAANYQDTQIDYVSAAIALRYVDAIVAQTGGDVNWSNHRKATHYLNQLKAWHRSYYTKYYVDGEVASTTTTARATAEAQVDADIGTSTATPRLTIADIAVDENAGNAVFTVTASVADIEDITVAYATSDGSATQPGDYTQTTGTATITAGAVTTTVNVPIVDDADNEGNESFTLTLSNSTNAEISDASATCTINASDGSR